MVTSEDLAQAILRMTENIEKSRIEIQKREEERDKKIEERDKKIEQQRQELREQMKKTDERLDRIAKQVGGISNNQGDVAEEFFYNSLASTQKLAGVQYDMIYKNLSKQTRKLRDEYDIVLVNGKDIAIVETKYKAHTDDVKKLIGKKYENFKKLYPEYKDYKHHLGLASFNMNEDVKEIALKNNVILLQRKGDLIETILPLSSS